MIDISLVSNEKTCYHVKLYCIVGVMYKGRNKRKHEKDATKERRE
jgi:hypothetical protein